jgi:hypothetical protein
MVGAELGWRGRLLTGVSLLTLSWMIPAAAQTVSGSITGPVTTGTAAVSVLATGTINGFNAGIVTPGGTNTPSIVVHTKGEVFGVPTAVAIQGTVGTLNNFGVISGRTGIANSGGMVGLLANHGDVVGSGGPGVLNSNGATIATLVNTGAIEGIGPAPSATGIVAGSSIGVITTPSGFSGGVTNGAGSTITMLRNNGTIVGVANSGVIGTLSNVGTISATGAAVQVDAGGSIAALRNWGGGVMSGATGVVVQSGGSVGAFFNAGTIEGTYSYNAGGISGIGTDGKGLVTNGTDLAVVNNAGTIFGGKTGISLNGGSIGLLNNSGLIEGGFAVSSTGGALGALHNSGVIDGNIQVSGQNLNLNTVSGQGTLTGGTITVTDGNLTNVAGSQLLQDDVVVKTRLRNFGTLEVGSGLSLTGGLALMSTGTYIEDIGATGHGQLDVSGTADFAGTLDINLLDGFALQIGDAFELFDAGAVSGDVTALELDGAACSLVRLDTYGCGVSYQLQEVWEGNLLDLDVLAISGVGPVVGRLELPEPPSFALLGFGLAAMGVIGWRKCSPADEKDSPAKITA